MHPKVIHCYEKSKLQLACLARSPGHELNETMQNGAKN